MLRSSANSWCPLSLSGLLFHLVTLEIPPTFFYWKVKDLAHGRSCILGCRSFLWSSGGWSVRPLCTDPIWQKSLGETVASTRVGWNKQSCRSLNVTSQEARVDALDKSFDTDSKLQKVFYRSETRYPSISTWNPPAQAGSTSAVMAKMLQFWTDLVNHADIVLLASAPNSTPSTPTETASSPTSLP